MKKTAEGKPFAAFRVSTFVPLIPGDQTIDIADRAIVPRIIP